MATIPADAYRALAAPFDHLTTTRLLALTSTDASVALETGSYELRLAYGATSVAFVRMGDDASDLVTMVPGDPAAAGFGVAPGDVVTVYHDASVGDGELHAILASGSETLLITCKAVA